MLADPGVTEITLPAGGAFTMPAGPITHTVTIKSDNAGVPYDSWNAADVVTITGFDFDSVDGNLTLEGVKVIGDKAVDATSTSGDLTITNCIFENSDGAGNAIDANVGGTITIENVLINGTATNYSGSGIVVLCNETDIIIKNTVIKGVKGNAIHIIGSTALGSLVIEDNIFENWDSDMDDVNGGRAIYIQFNSDAPFNESIKGNTLTAPAYGSAPKDKELILLENVQKIGYIEFSGNTINGMHATQNVLSMDIDGVAGLEEYVYVSRLDAGAYGAYALEKVAELAKAEFDSGVRVAGYLPGPLGVAVFQAMAHIENGEALYTPSTWTAYQAFVNGITDETSGADLYEASLVTLPVEKAKLQLRKVTASNDAELGLYLANPEIEEITLAKGDYTIVVAPAGDIVIKGPYAGTSGLDPARDPAEEAVLKGGVQTTKSITLLGVRVETYGVEAKGTGEVIIRNSVFANISKAMASAGNDAPAIGLYNAGTAIINNVKIDGAVGDSSYADSVGMGIKSNGVAITSIIIMNSHIENTSHNAINLFGLTQLVELEISGNVLKAWDSDMDQTGELSASAAGGRALRINFDNVAPLVAMITDNTMTAPDYAGAGKTPVDKDYMKLTNVQAIDYVVFDGNTISEPIPGQWILSSWPETAKKDYGYVSRDNGATYEFELIADLAPADFAASLRVAGYLPSAQAHEIYLAEAVIANPDLYTANSKAAYQGKVDLITAANTPKEIYEATLGLPALKEAELILKKAKAANADELERLLGDPGVEEIEITASFEYDKEVAPLSDLVLKGPNHHTHYDDPRDPEVVFSAGIKATHYLKLDGVKVINKGVFGSGSKLIVSYSIFENISQAHAGASGDAIAIEGLGAEEVFINYVKISGVGRVTPDDVADMGIRIRGAQKIVVLGNHIQDIDHNAINIYDNPNLSELAIQYNKLYNWDKDKDKGTPNAGGRAIRIAFDNVNQFGAFISNNTFTCADYGVELAEDPEFIKITDISKLSSLVMGDNTINDATKASNQYILGLAPVGSNSVENTYAYKAGAVDVEFVKVVALEVVDFAATTLTFYGHLDTQAEEIVVYEAVLAKVPAADELLYTPTSWAAYQAVLGQPENQVTVDNSLQEIYVATRNIAQAQEALVLKDASASSDEELAALLADPEVESITLEPGEYALPDNIDHDVTIKSGNAGTPPSGWAPGSAVVLTGGITTADADVNLDGVQLEGSGVVATGTGNVTIENTSFENITGPNAIDLNVSGVITITNVVISGTSVEDTTTTGIYVKCDETHIVIQNVTIENVKGDAIKIETSAVLEQLDIKNNVFKNWDYDKDGVGRAIHIQFNNTNPFAVNIMNNAFTAIDYGVGAPVDKELILLEKAGLVSQFVFNDNTFSGLHASHQILAMDIDGVAGLEEYAYVSKDDGATYEFKLLASLVAADFELAAGKLIVAGYLADGNTDVHTAVKTELDAADYTAQSWTAYQQVITDNEVTAASTGAQIYNATLAIKLAQADLRKPIMSVDNDEALAAAVGDPEVTEVTLAAGTYNTAINVDRKFTLYGPNQGISGLSAERKPEALLLGGIGTYGGGLEVDGVKLETYGIYARLNLIGDVEIRNTVINDVTTPHDDEYYGALSGIHLRNAGAVTIDSVKITNINHNRANNGITLASYDANNGAATDIVIRNSHIENVTHNAITVSSSFSISGLEIANNTLINWNSDMDADVGDNKEGGRALRLSVQTSTQPPFALKIQNNTMTAPNYEAAGAHITDEDFIKINGTSKLSSVIFEGNVISQPVEGLCVLGMSPIGGANKPYAYLKNADASYSFVKVNEFGPADFNAGLEFAGYLADGNTDVHTAVKTELDEGLYTPASWAVYQQVIAENPADGSSTGEQIYDATLNIKLAQADLVLKD